MPNGELAIKKTTRTAIGVPGATGGISADVPETPLPAALQTDTVKTVEDARGVQAANQGSERATYGTTATLKSVEDPGTPWQGDGDGSHWSNH